jgi:hypothetical protein
MEHVPCCKALQAALKAIADEEQAVSYVMDSPVKLKK